MKMSDMLENTEQQYGQLCYCPRCGNIVNDQTCGICGMNVLGGANGEALNLVDDTSKHSDITAGEIIQVEDLAVKQSTEVEIEVQAVDEEQPTTEREYAQFFVEKPPRMQPQYQAQPTMHQSFLNPAQPPYGNGYNYPQQPYYANQIQHNGQMYNTQTPNSYMPTQYSNVASPQQSGGQTQYYAPVEQQIPSGYQAPAYQQQPVGYQDNIQPNQSYQQQSYQQQSYPQQNYPQQINQQAAQQQYCNNGYVNNQAAYPPQYRQVPIQPFQQSMSTDYPNRPKKKKWPLWITLSSIGVILMILIIAGGIKLTTLLKDGEFNINKYQFDDSTSSDDKYHYSNGVSPSELEQIKKGMSYAHVSKLIGGDGIPSDSGTTPLGDDYYTYAWIGENKPNTYVYITFQNDAVSDVVSDGV